MENAPTRPMNEEELRAEVARLNSLLAEREQAVKSLKREVEKVYYDRNMLVLLALKLATKLTITCGKKIDEDDRDWPVVFIKLPILGQVSWHIPASLMPSWVPIYNEPWDGHSIEEKNRKIKQYTMNRG